jgi:hypothetical protein
MKTPETDYGLHPGPWEARSTNFGESMGYDSRSAIYDANGALVVTLGRGDSRGVFIAEATAERIIRAVNNAEGNA